MAERPIFLSHAAVDKGLAEAIVDLLEKGMGVPKDVIFCTSLEGHGIPVGLNFIEHIKQQIQGARLVIPLVTKSYCNSPFCLCELGATWALQSDIWPILLPPVRPSDVNNVLAHTQVVTDILDVSALEVLRTKVRTIVACSDISEPTWRTRRGVFTNQVHSRLPESATGEWWIYGLIAKRDGMALHVAGCFQVERVSAWIGTVKWQGILD